MQSLFTATSSSLPDSRDYRVSASRVPGTAGLHFHTLIIFCIILEMGFHHIDQDGLDLLTL